MKRSLVYLLSILLAPPLFADAGQRLIPAGSLIGCTISEPRISSSTTAVGDPVLCQVGHSERYGRSVLPYNSYLVGRFEDYKDPGHFLGKGWMELRFDRMVIEPDTIIPIDARVVGVPGYRVDNQGRILGKGHATRDIVTWSIPVLWPIDLLMLPMRGPRPTLKEETRLTLKVMDDMAVPTTTEPQTDPYGLRHRQPSAELNPPPAPMPDTQPEPETTAYAPPNEAQPAPYENAPPQPAPYTYSPPPLPAAYAFAPVAIMPAPVAYAPVVVMPAPVYAYVPVGVPQVYGYPYAAPRAYGYSGAVRSYGYTGPSHGYVASRAVYSGRNGVAYPAGR
jgi:hypothetical protein